MAPNRFVDDCGVLQPVKETSPLLSARHTERERPNGTFRLILMGRIGIDTHKCMAFSVKMTLITLL